MPTTADPPPAPTTRDHQQGNGAVRRIAEELDVHPDALALALPQPGVCLPAPAGREGAVQDVVAVQGRLLSSHEVAIQSADDQLVQRLNGPDDDGLGHTKRLTDGNLGQVVAQTDKRPLAAIRPPRGSPGQCGAVCHG